MKKLLIILSLIVLAMGPVTTFAADKAGIPEYTVEGLKLVPDTKDIALVWAEPGANLAQYKRINLVEPVVAFKKNWRKDQNRSSAVRVTAHDMDRIKAEVGKLFVEVFTEELTAGGYSLTTERAEDVLTVKPAILDLDVKAPDTHSASRGGSFVTSAGSMTLYLELYDSETNDLLAKALDPTADRESSLHQYQSGAANRQAAKRMMKPWAEALRKGLDKAREASPEE
ncbi:DUF3313 family protein [Pseudomonadota bacterium]